MQPVSSTVAVKPDKQWEHRIPVRLLLHRAVLLSMERKSNGAGTAHPLLVLLLHPQKPAGQRAADVRANDNDESLSVDMFLKNIHNPEVTLMVPVQNTMPYGQPGTPSVEEKWQLESAASDVLDCSSC